MAFFFVLDGLDAVTSAIGVAMLELARRPDVCTRLREYLDTIGVFADESSGWTHRLWSSPG
ncbi:cytochrome P450 [Mycobacterium tilburgii]|uniref:cytochrome P450 n=1 Tax=Mycobacterium tilburgii TaxID=44467 RepID=UPI0021B4C8BD|nr:cytochrome P450 [Mycobacterium tilburgii]